MKRIFAALGLLLALIAPAAAQVPTQCNLSAVYDTNTNGATKMITGGTTRSIYVCGYTLFAGGTASVSFVSGTGTNCGTDQVALTPAFPLIAQVGITDSASQPRGLIVARGLDFCIKTTAGVAIQAIVYYRQQ